jgi:LAO/AO transport system kinase
MTLADSVRGGDRLALARLLTLVENDTADARSSLHALFPYTGRAHLVGVTGAPGTGKSSLVNRLALHFRGQEKKVAIAAVDPSSPFTGGAVLGDRVRMKDLSGDSGVFIRSMASRGALGGLAQSTAGMAYVFDAAGFELIIIETVGAGQGEVDIARLAHTTLVVEAPGMGDEIQAIKAGILEIADILVLNKADRPGVENTEKALRSVLDLAHPTQRVFMHHGQVVNSAMQVETKPQMWIVPLEKTVSTEGKGIPALADQIDRHAEYLRASGNWAAREQSRLASEMQALLQQTLLNQFHARLPDTRYDEIMHQVFARDLSPWEAVRLLTDGAGSTSDAAKGSVRPQGHSFAVREET